MDNQMFVVIGCAGVCLSPEDVFICETSENEQILSKEKAKSLKEELDKNYGKDYSYHVARLSFLD